MREAGTSKVELKSRYFWLEMVLMGDVYTARVQCRVCTHRILISHLPCIPGLSTTLLEFPNTSSAKRA